MVIEIPEMIDTLEEFFRRSDHELVVGGIAGTEIEKYVLDAATYTTDFSKILVVNGCQDYLGLMKKPLDNYVFWGDLFVEEIVDPLIPRNPWLPEILNSKPEFRKRVDSTRISRYDIIINFNAHLIPGWYIGQISNSFSGKIISVVDPFDGNAFGTLYQYGIKDILVITDTLSKVSPLTAMARSSLGFDTRSVDTKAHGTLNEVSKINYRSIGKIDDKQYISDDFELVDDIRRKQMESPFRKNQKVLVNDDIVDINIDSEGFRKASVVRNSMLVIENPSQTPLMKMRLYNSNQTYFTDVTYQEGILVPRSSIPVMPANIMTIYQSAFHRFNHTILILTEKIDPNRRYSVLKNSINVTVVNKSK